MGEDTRRKVAILLLILAIVFSTISILIGGFILYGDIPQQKSVAADRGEGTLGLFVESSQTLSEGAG